MKRPPPVDPQRWGTDSILKKSINSGLILWIPLYCISGIFTPIMIDYVRYNGGTNDWPPTLLPMLANTTGMALVSILAKKLKLKTIKTPKVGRERADSDLFHGLPFENKVQILIATALDFGSAACTIIGLLHVGSGIFTVIYSSCTAWTALISWYYGKQMDMGQWIGIFIVTLGLGLNGYGIVDEFGITSGKKLIIGCGILLFGTVLHSASFVYNEAVITPASKFVRVISPFFLCTMMGQLEAGFLFCWNVVLSSIYGASSLYTVQPLILICYTGLVFSNAIHALAFFAMLGQLGAVSTGIMKGLLSVCILAFSSLFFCQNEASQCLTPTKALSFIVTLFGSLTFIMATSDDNSMKRSRVSSSNSPNADLYTRLNKLNTV